MKHSYAEEAIRLAMQGHWVEAVTLNEKIIELSPNDVDAHNRLGKALSELGHYSEARKAYERVLEIDSMNNIAKRNLQRLSYLKEGEKTPKEARSIDSNLFIEETSKARMTVLCRVAPKEILAKIAAGDRAFLQIRDQRLAVVGDSGEYLGEIEPAIGSRLIELMEGGNEYQVVIISLRENRIKVIIRETFQHPSQVGLLSFPRRAFDDVRPYLKDTLVKYDLDDELFGEGEESADWEIEAGPQWKDELSPEEEMMSLAQGDTDKLA